MTNAEMIKLLTTMADALKACDYKTADRCGIELAEAILTKTDEQVASEKRRPSLRLVHEGKES